jgi:hypothetical protein
MRRALDLRSELLEVGDKRREGERLRAEASEQLSELVPLAFEAGVPIAEIGRLAGLSRQGVYNLLDRKGSGPGEPKGGPR